MYRSILEHHISPAILRQTVWQRALPISICLALLAVSNTKLQAQYNGSFTDIRPVVGLEAPGQYRFPNEISDDGLTMWLSSARNQRGAHADLFVATRESVLEPFGEPQEIASLNIGGVNFEQTISADGLTTYFCSDRLGLTPGARAEKIWTAGRASLDSDWGAPQVFKDGACDVELADDDLTLYYRSNNGVLVAADRTNLSEPFGEPQPTLEDFPERFFEISDDELTIMFTNRGGPTADTLVSQRVSKDDPFSEPVKLEDFGLGSEIDTRLSFQGHPVLSANWPEDGSKLYFAGGNTNRFGTTVSIYEATWSVGDPIFGDVTGEGFLTVEDLDQLTYEIHAGSTDTNFDLDESGSVDLADRDFWVTNVMSTSIGDANLDGQVTATDLNALALNWRATDVTSWSQGDFTGDGIVDAKDLNAMALNWQSGVAAGAATPTAVPEPSSATLLLLGLCTLIRRAGRGLR